MIEIHEHETSSVIQRSDLRPEDREEMFALLSRHFDGVKRRQFDHDLDEKNWVIQLRWQNRLVGFSTLLATASIFDGVSLTVIYSGDTIVAPEAWGTPALARQWIATVNCIRGEFPGRRCYWLLLASGFRTYRFLPVFWKEFFPRFDVATPLFQQRLIRHLARERYGNLFDETAWIVRFSQPQRLREHLSEVPSGRAQDPHVGFFLLQNPGHSRGDELVCLTEIDESNLTRAGRRMVAEPGP